MGVIFTMIFQVKVSLVAYNCRGYQIIGQMATQNLVEEACRVRVDYM